MLSLLFKPTVVTLFFILATVFYVSNGDFSLFAEYGENTQLSHILNQNELS